MMALVGSLGMGAITLIGVEATGGITAPVYFGWVLWFFVMWLLDYRTVKLVVRPGKNKR